jgi:Ca2+-binding RTX toxin-like protein
MYMISMIGMAIVTVPRGIYRALMWLLMTFVGWCMSSIESAYAAVTANYSNGQITATVTGAGASVTVGKSGESVVVWGDGTPSVMTTDAALVTAIVINGDSNNDTIDISAVTNGNGFTHAALITDVSGNSGNDIIYGSGRGDFLYGNNGNDTIYGNAGVDIMEGGDGADYLSGGADSDTMYHFTQAQGTNADGDTDTIDGGASGDFDVGYRRQTGDNDATQGVIETLNSG